ncbi:MAG: hypothetical protein II707_03500 [Spirochaetales bacterium]|nr:hypothetical protein [Spirochaetales bacterium]
MPFIPFRQAKDIILNDCRILRTQGRFVELEFYLKKYKKLLLFGAAKYYRTYYQFYHGIVRFNLGKYREAIKIFQDFLLKIDNPSAFPTDEAYYYLIRCFLILGNEAEANVYLNLLTERLNSPLFILLSLYYMKLYKVRHQVNLNLLFEAAEGFDDEPDLAVTTLMRILSDFIRDDSDPQNIIAKTRSSFARFSEYNTNYYFSLIRMSFLFHHGFYEAILEHTDYQMVCNSFELLNIYCAALYKRGLINECITCLKKAVVCNEASFFHINLAKCYIVKKEYTNALKILSGIKDKSVSDYRDFLTGICQQKLGSFNEAVSAYKRIPQHSPYHDKAQLNLAAIYYDDFDYSSCRDILAGITQPRVRDHDVYRFLMSKTDGSVNTKNISVLIFFMSGFLAVLVALIVIVFIFLRLIG